MHPSFAHRVAPLTLVITLGLGCHAATYGEYDTVANTTDAATGSETATSTSGEAGDNSADTDCTIGAEGCTCTAGGGCDPGLLCEAGLCVSCLIGSQSCTCTAGGGCDPGLDCEAGLCVPSSSTGDGDGDTGSGDGDGDTGSGDGDGDGDALVCELDQACEFADPDACVCQGCFDNGTCWQNEDCVCNDCTKQEFCTGNNCTNDGVCNPYFEGCSCADCVHHPECP